MSTSETWRLFIAFEIPQEILRDISRLQDKLKDNFQPKVVRWVRPEGIHLTLKFLGDVPAAKSSQILQALEPVVSSYAVPRVVAKRIGCFPNLARPRVIWVGIEDDSARLIQIAQSVESAINPLGYPVDKRGFTPHLTLGRIAQPLRREEVAILQNLIETHSNYNLSEWGADTIKLMRSHLQSNGAQYESVGEIVLRG